MMKKHLSQICILCILLVISMSCDKENDVRISLPIQGEWVWVESVGGDAGETFTPENTIKTSKLIIDDFILQEFINDSLVLETEYELGISSETFFGTKGRTTIKFASAGSRQTLPPGLDRGTLEIVVEETELTLIEQCLHCYCHVYTRE